MQQQDKKALKALGKHIKKLRMQKSTSLNAFLLRTGGISPASLSRIENGLVDFKITSMLKIAAALEMPVGEVLEGFNFKYDLALLD